MVDALDRMIVNLRRLEGRARVGALDEVNATKLFFQEVGTEDAPARPTLSATTDRLEGAMHRAIARKVGGVLDGKVHTTGQEILADVARDLQEEVVAAINNNTPPPLAESTKANRRARGNPSTRTLVDSGQMRDHITVESKANARPWED